MLYKTIIYFVIPHPVRSRTEKDPEQLARALAPNCLHLHQTLITPVLVF